MRKLSFLFVFTFFLLVNAAAQTIPRGMKYQAVARDLKGEILANTKIALRINLLSKKDGSEVSYYNELHDVITNQLGLFTLVVGDGKTETGEFDKVPWSTADIWMKIEIRTAGQANFTSISNSQLLAVPYAYHALTAGEVIGAVLQEPVGERNFNWKDKCPCEQGIAQVKLLYLGPSPVTIKAFENQNLNPNTLDSTFTNVVNGQIIVLNALVPDGKLKNETFFQIIGANPAIPVVEIPTSCDEQFVGENFGNFSILSHKDKKNGAECTVCDVKMDWKINGNALLDMCNKIGTRSYTDFIFITKNLERMRITKDGDINIANNLNVVGNTTSQGSLTVNGPTIANSTLTVNGVATMNNTFNAKANVNLNTPLNGETINNGPLTVLGPTTLQGPTTFNNSINISQNSPDGSWLAVLNNTNGEGGDGMKIKLGKAKSIYTPPGTSGLGESQVNDIKEFLNTCINIPGPQRVAALARILVSELVEGGKAIAGIAVGAGNLIVQEINNALHLPYQIGPLYTPAIPMWDRIHLFGPLDIGIATIPSLDIPGLTIPALPVFPVPITVMPALPTINIPGLPDIGSLEFWGLPNLCPQDNNTAPLNKQNEFIRFTDKNDAKVGSIRGMSVADWSDKYFLNPIWLSGLYSAITSSKLDKFHARYHFQTLIFDALAKYGELGVEYSSGNGDYAEWLQRENSTERINAGDIVAVVGGRITKHLECAEQVMVVSHKPIVLGNVPDEKRFGIGNIIAFMGQVPVKVNGPVMSGDYIVGFQSTPGYGVAKHPNEMTIEDFKQAVGRSWDSDMSNGPKLVNTVVGVHNGDYFKILKKFENKLSDSENRLKNLENKVDQLLNTNEKPKKGF